MKEADIEKALAREVRRMGGRAYKWVSPGNDGVPDRIVILPNRMPVFVELKAEKGRLTSLQQVQIQRLRELGQDARVLYGMDEVKEFLKESEEQINDI